MKPATKRTRTPRQPKDFDSEIAAAEARLTKLRSAKREKERRDQEENTEAVIAFIKRNGWHAISVTRWQSVEMGIESVLRSAPIAEPAKFQEWASGPEQEAA